MRPPGIETGRTATRRGPRRPPHPTARAGDRAGAGPPGPAPPGDRGPAGTPTGRGRATATTGRRGRHARTTGDATRTDASPATPRATQRPATPTRTASASPARARGDGRPRRRRGGRATRRAPRGQPKKPRDGRPTHTAPKENKPKGASPRPSTQPESLLQSRLRLGADRCRCGLAVLEEDHHRDRLDPVALRERRLLVDVHLDELDVAVRLLHDPVEHGGDGVAGPAPFGPEVDDHRLVALEDFLFEALFGHCGCHSVLSSESIGRTLTRTLRNPGMFHP